jgi:hypothetical protein
MAEQTTDPVEAPAPRFVQIGDQVFNRDHIVNLSRKTSRETRVMTLQGRDVPVSVPITVASAALGVDYLAVSS